MSYRDLSANNDGKCCACGGWAAEGGSVDGKSYCAAHVQALVWCRAEVALWDFVRCFGSWDTLDELMEQMLAHRLDSPWLGYVTGRSDVSI